MTTEAVVSQTAGGSCAGTVRGAPLPRSLRGALFATSQASLVEALVSWCPAKNVLAGTTIFLVGNAAAGLRSDERSKESCTARSGAQAQQQQA